jgi:phosphoribosyl 1,2-cyclic phosphodiesterase
MKILILEDSSERIFEFKKRLISHDVTYTMDTKECIHLLKEQTWDYICLDHDLTNVFEKPGEGTGYEVARFIAENPSCKPRHILIHTMNNVGASAMMLVLGRVGIRATYIPCLWLKIQV